MNIFLPLIVVVAIYVSIKDYKVLKRHKSFKTYMTLIDPVYQDKTDDFLSCVDEYIEEEKMNEFKIKARILKVFSLLKENRDGYKEVLKDIDLKELLLNKKNKIDRTKQLLNSDIYFWFLLSSIEADLYGNSDAIKSLSELLSEYEESLANELYYQMILTYINEVTDHKGLDLYKKVLAGDYSEYTYAKDLIAIFKRVAIAILIYKGEKVEEEDEKILYSFAESEAGHFVLNQLNLYEKYNNKEEEE